MATDKSINIKQMEATEKLAVTLAEINEKMAALQAGMDQLLARLKPLESASNQVARRSRQ